jgi:sec-independent protein translocase protein TatA
MFSGTFSIGHWLILMVIVLAVFGTKKLRGAGSDLGAAIRNFKAAVREGEAAGAQLDALPLATRPESGGSRTASEQAGSKN